MAEADARVDQISRQRAAAWPTHPVAPLMRVGPALRGVDGLTAATRGDPATLSHPRAVMAWVGSVPSEAYSGVTRRPGGMTKTGTLPWRRVLVAAAHRYRVRACRPGAVGRRLATRGAWAPALSAISGRSPRRRHARLRTLPARRGTPKAIAAVARGLCGCLGEIAVWVRVPPPGQVPPAA